MRHGAGLDEARPVRRWAAQLLVVSTLVFVGAACSGNGPSVNPSRSIALPSRSPTIAPASPAPITSTSPAAANTSSTSRWVWFIVAVVLLGGSALLIALMSRRRKVREWRTRAAAANATGSTLSDALSAAIPSAGPPSAGPPPGADTRWSQIDALADSFVAELHGLETGVPGQAERTTLASVTVALAPLRSAIQAYRAAPGVETLDTLRSTLSAFDAALASLRTAAHVGAPPTGSRPNLP
jgi:hypothetical protein